MNHAVHNKIISFKGITSPAYSIYRLKVQASKRFFHHLLRTEIYQAEYKRKFSGVIESRLCLYTEKFFDVWSLIPPLSELTAIADFLDCKTTKIDQAIAIKEKQMIEKLKQYKATLINSAVTGKIKLPVTAVAKAVA